jgi:diguanylate cyclase (GGDEF)-like protein/putative nucleotidyltransferase with HDIG domain
MAVDLVAHIVPGETFQQVVPNVVTLGAALLCGWRAVGDRRERLPWALAGAGLLAWGLGDVYYTFAFWDADVIPVPSPSDAGYLLFYPLLYAALVLLVRGRVTRLARTVWVDGLIGALAVGALVATLLSETIEASTSGSAVSVAVNLAYPLADLLILAMVAGVLAMTGWRLNSAWGWIAGGTAVYAATDAVYLYQSTAGGYLPGSLLDVGWPLAALMLAFAAWRPVPAPRPVDAVRGVSIVLPVVLGFACIALLLADHVGDIGAPAVGLAAATLMTVLVRLAMTFAENARMLDASRHESRTDALTGLGNRRALMADLERAVDHAGAGAGTVTALALFDLDGFKSYNDSFGHPAGDALLGRLGAALRDTVGDRGTAYRMGGDEFCVLCTAPEGDVRTTLADAAFALTERGEGFTVGCSYGSVLVGHEARTAEEALRSADQRMYLSKQGGRVSAGRQSGDVLRQALSERHPDLGRHMSDVAALADAVARRLGLPDAAIDEVRLAAELHDIGKVAIPDAIVDKPGPLDDEEWGFMRSHTIIGARIVNAAPALSAVARLVRSSHERVDGGGYPDGLAGDEIPLGARIVFVCDAFHAMVSQRSYASGIAEAEAVAELRRCAGTQFDAGVVEAFCGVLAERDAAAARPKTPELA